MKHVQAKSILNSSEKSGDKYLEKTKREKHIHPKINYGLTQHTLAKAWIIQLHKRTGE
jgi:hypothetical protein